jgi:hypothetical protein
MRDQGILSAVACERKERSAHRRSALRRIAITRNHSHHGRLRPLLPGGAQTPAVCAFGADRVLRGGLRVYSTYDPELQRQAESAVTTRIAEIVSPSSCTRSAGSLVAMDPPRAT